MLDVLASARFFFPGLPVRGATAAWGVLLHQSPFSDERRQYRQNGKEVVQAPKAPEIREVTLDPR
jgi:hypothetical protein